MIPNFEEISTIIWKENRLFWNDLKEAYVLEPKHPEQMIFKIINAIFYKYEYRFTSQIRYRDEIQMFLVQLVKAYFYSIEFELSLKPNVFNTFDTMLKDVNKGSHSISPAVLRSIIVCGSKENIKYALDITILPYLIDFESLPSKYHLSLDQVYSFNFLQSGSIYLHFKNINSFIEMCKTVIKNRYKILQDFLEQEEQAEEGLIYEILEYADFLKGYRCNADSTKPIPSHVDNKIVDFKKKGDIGFDSDSGVASTKNVLSKGMLFFMFEDAVTSIIEVYSNHNKTNIIRSAFKWTKVGMHSTQYSYIITAAEIAHELLYMDIGKITNSVLSFLTLGIISYGSTKLANAYDISEKYVSIIPIVLYGISSQINLYSACSQLFIFQNNKEDELGYKNYDAPSDCHVGDIAGGVTNDNIE